MLGVAMTTLEDIHKHCIFCNSRTTKREPTKLVKIYPVDPEDKQVAVTTYVHVSCIIDTKIHLDNINMTIYDFKAKVLGIFDR